MLIMVSNYHMMCFTSFITEAEAQYTMGASLQYCIIGAIIANILKMVIALVAKAKAKIELKKRLKDLEI